VNGVVVGGPQGKKKQRPLTNLHPPSLSLDNGGGGGVWGGGRRLSKPASNLWTHLPLAAVKLHVFIE